MLKCNENQDLAYIALQLSEIKYLIDRAGNGIYTHDFVLSLIREHADNALNTFEQPKEDVIFPYTGD